VSINAENRADSKQQLAHLTDDVVVGFGRQRRTWTLVVFAENCRAVDTGAVVGRRFVDVARGFAATSAGVRPADRLVAVQLHTSSPQPAISPAAGLGVEVRDVQDGRVQMVFFVQWCNVPWGIKTNSLKISRRSVSRF